jgi:hypothetical protein
VPELNPQPFALLGWAVADIHAAIAALVAKGVEFNRYAGMEQDDDGVRRITERMS